MAVEFNHTILNVRDRHASARWVADILGLEPPSTLFDGYFVVVKLAHGASLDFVDSDEPIEPMHYAFLVSDAEFDQIFGRIKEREVTYWADPARMQAGEINHHFGGRGCYFCEPSGHFLEIITRPYSE